MASKALEPFVETFQRDGFTLNGKEVSTGIAQAITGVQLELSMEGPSILTVTVADSGYQLMRDGMLAEKKGAWKHVTAQTGALYWTLSELEKDDAGFVLTFYSSAAAALKDTSGAYKKARGTVTRAEFAGALCKRAGVPFASPDEHVRQPIETLTKDEQQQVNDAKASVEAQAKTRQQISRGSLNGKGVKVKGAKADREQLRNIERALSVAEALGAETKPKLALLQACIQESTFRNLDHGPGSVIGILQLTDDHLGGSVSTNGGRRDVELVAKLFLTEGFRGTYGAMTWAKKRPQASPGEIAELCQGSGMPAAYDQWAGEAVAILRARSGGESDASLDDLQSLTGTPDVARRARYEFRVERNVSYFEALVNLAQDVNWRFFETVGVAFFVSDATLARADPSMAIAEGAKGIRTIRYKLQRRGRIDNITVECNLKDWSALPGQVILVDGEGPEIDGRWLVRTLERDLLDRSGSATITLGKPQKAKKEPSPGLVTSTGSDPAVDADSVVGSKAAAAKAFAKADQIAKQKYPYSYGGGHNATFAPNYDSRRTGAFGYDCSGFVSAVLHAGGMGLDNPLDTVLLGQWGKPGKGKYLTVWVRPLQGLTGHTGWSSRPPTPAAATSSSKPAARAASLPDDALSTPTSATSLATGRARDSGERGNTSVMEPLLSPDDVARITGLSVYTVRAAVCAGELSASILRRRIRIHPDDLAAWIDDNRVRPGASVEARSTTRNRTPIPRSSGPTGRPSDDIMEWAKEERRRRREADR